MSNKSEDIAAAVFSSLFVLLAYTFLWSLFIISNFYHPNENLENFAIRYFIIVGSCALLTGFGFWKKKNTLAIIVGALPFLLYFVL